MLNLKNQIPPDFVGIPINRENPKLIFLVGPTAVGKSETAVYLAKKINAEIVSCDSMQVYKGMDIVTSKPSSGLRKKNRHHLIDIVHPTREYNVAKYRQEALRKIKEIINKGKIPLFVGGTGLYMSILIDGIFKTKYQNRNIRNQLYKQAKKFGSEFLYKKLEKIDPEAALRIHPHDSKRIIRAIEVFQISGQPISNLQKQRKGLVDKYDLKIFCLNMERKKLYQKINKRIEAMFNKGLVKEVKKLLKLKLSKTAFYAIGIKELKGYFEGLYDLEEARQLMKRNTQLYAKKQLTWFRKDKRIEWIGIDDKESPREIAKRIWKELY